MKVLITGGAGFVGVRLARRIGQVLFYRFLYAGMFLTGVKLLWDGLR